MLMMGLNETIDQLAIAKSLHWHGHGLMRVLDFELEDQREKGRPKKTWMKQAEEKSVKFFLEKGRCTLSIKEECRRKSDFCWVDVNLATLICWGYYQMLNIGVSLSVYN